MLWQVPLSAKSSLSQVSQSTTANEQLSPILNMLKKIAFSFSLLACTGLALAQDEAARPELLRKLDGKWRMSGEVRGKPVTYSMQANPTLLGAFTELRMQDVQVPAKYAANVSIGYDKASKTVIVHWLDSFGAKYSIPHGTGYIEENTVRFTFPYEGGQFRDTFTFHPEAGDWTFVLESMQADGNWKNFAKYTVVRDIAP